MEKTYLVILTDGDDAHSPSIVTVITDEKTEESVILKAALESIGWDERDIDLYLRNDAGEDLSEEEDIDNFLAYIEQKQYSIVEQADPIRC